MLISAWQRASTRSVCANRFKRSSCEWAHVTNLTVGFKGNLALNTVLDVAKDGGKGFLLNPIFNEKLVNETGKAYLKYVQGGIH